MVGGILYIIFKNKKTKAEWFILLTSIGLMVLIYEQTYMKWFSPIIITILSGIGLKNFYEYIRKKEKVQVISIILISFVIFTGYFNFIHHYFVDFDRRWINNERYIEEATLKAGDWLEENANGLAIANDLKFGTRLFSAAKTVHFVTGYTLLDYTYGLLNVSFSEFEMYPITSDEFWFGAFKMRRDYAEIQYYSLNNKDTGKLDYYAENKKCGVRICWHHTHKNANLLKNLHSSGNLIYQNSKVRIWKL